MTVITRQWLIKTVSIISAVMFLVAGSLSAVLYYYYYNTARSKLNSGYNNIVERYFESSSGTTQEDFNRAARGYIDTIDPRDKDRIGVWVIDAKGRVVATSDGFKAPSGVEMIDYTQALSSEKGTATWKGHLPGGEKIMATTFLLRSEDPKNASALRYMVSMDKVDAQLRNLVVLLFIVAFAAVILAVVPGTLYIEKLVLAVNNTTKAADRIAKGDYDTRIAYSGRDEIGALCTAVHNMAEEISAAEHMKNDFISTVSHELRTPLTAIRGWGETLRQVGGEDPLLYKKGMDVILSETDRLGGMVEDLLDFSRIQSGSLKLRRVAMDVLAQLEDSVFTFQQRAAREGKTLFYDVSDAQAPIYGDPDRITQVFINIIDNALKYTPKGGTIRIETAQSPKRIRIFIRDNGKGIAPEDLPHIKEKFYKADSTVRGSGIGLAVADEIIRLHGGELRLESAPGVGTNVCITLPLQSTQEGGLENG